MRAERGLIWAPLLGLAACSPGIVALSASTHCWGLPWICQDWSGALRLARPELFVLFVWLSLVACGLRAGVSQLHRTRRAIRRLPGAAPVELPPSLAGLVYDLGIQNRLDVAQCSAAETFCYGFFRPRIYVTTGMLDILSAAEIKAVLTHERHHLRRYDPLRSLLWTVLDGACWWIENGSQQARLQRELAADRAVVMAGGRMALASALVKLLAHPERGAIAAQDLSVSSLSVTDARIEQLLRPEQIPQRTRPRFHLLILPAMISLTMMLCGG